MLRTTAIGLVSAIALGVGIASPAGAMDGKTGGGAGYGANVGRSTMTVTRSDSGRSAQHDMGRMWMGKDHDHDHDRGHDRDRDRDRDRHDHDRFRFVRALDFGVNNYADVYDPGYSSCWELHKVRIHKHLELRRVWVCY